MNTSLSEAFHTRPGLSDTAIAELQELPGDEYYLRQHRVSLGSRPVRVITATQHFNDTAATPPNVRAMHVRLNREMLDAQADLLGLSSDSKQILASHSRSGYVQFDEPQLALDAITEAAGRRSNSVPKQRSEPGARQ